VCKQGLVSSDGLTFYFIINNAISINKKVSTAYPPTGIGQALSLELSINYLSLSSDNNMMIILDSNKNLAYFTYNASSTYFDNKINFGTAASANDAITISFDKSVIVSFG
jgi:hypothetical protein